MHHEWEGHLTAQGVHLLVEEEVHCEEAAKDLGPDWVHCSQREHCLEEAQSIRVQKAWNVPEFDGDAGFSRGRGPPIGTAPAGGLKG